MRGVRFLEHTSDIYAEAYGADLREAFEEAGKTIFVILVQDSESVRPVEVKKVESSGYDDHSLLYDWLERLLLLFDIERFVGCEVRVLELSRGESYRVVGEVVGEKFDPARHRPGIHIKSPTYWLMEVVEKEDGAYVRFVLDI
ncbi:MAG: archease [Candidatus Caldarchaeales archaeon]|jgi:SHS2 domain-containing protein|nr:archease [Candidatus Caldarchaeales archaeon]